MVLVLAAGAVDVLQARQHEGGEGRCESAQVAGEDDPAALLLLGQVRGDFWGEQY